MAATEFTLQAMTGGPAIRGARAWPPTSVGGQFGEYIIGVFAAVAALIAVRQRALTGAGGTFDLSGLEASIMTQLFNPSTMGTQVGGVHMKRQKAPVADVVESKDGFVGFTVIAKLQNWLDLCAMIGQSGVKRVMIVTDAVLVKPLDAGTLRRTMKQLLATTPPVDATPAPA